MLGEYGSTNYTNNDPYTNSGKATEGRMERPNPSPHEFHNYATQSETSASPQKKSGRSLFRTITTAAAATVAVVAVLPAVISPSVDVRFEYLHATDTVLEYVISLDPVPEENDLAVVVATPNGNAVWRDPVTGGVMTGTVKGLLPGIRYEISVVDGDAELASRSVVMSYLLTTELSGVEHECQCAVDGTFHFQIFFKDENGYWSDFKATLTDSYGTTSECDFSDAPDAEHTLDVNGAGMRGETARLVISCTTTQPDENGDRSPREYILYEQTVSI